MVMGFTLKSIPAIRTLLSVVVQYLAWGLGVYYQILPIVEINVGLKTSSAKRYKIAVFPTPESPMSKILMGLVLMALLMRGKKVARNSLLDFRLLW